jgi:predicted O-methyltransferase YrrM
VTKQGRAFGPSLKGLLASYRQPNEIANYIGMHAALIADRVLAKSSAYSAIDWPAALLELDGFYPGIGRFLQEPEIARVENYTRLGSVALRTDGQAVAFNSDRSFARCLYLICRAIVPRVVVETGVAYGMSSAFILQAMEVNQHGQLHSIDLPLPRRDSRYQTGALIPPDLRHRWRLHRGPSKRELPNVVRSQNIDVFVHDSLHTYRNMRSEFQFAWPRLRAGGVLVSDDVEGNRAFSELREREHSYWQVVRQVEKPDSFFGLVIHR